MTLAVDKSSRKRLRERAEEITFEAAHTESTLFVGTAETHEFAFLNDAQELGLRSGLMVAISSKKMVPGRQLQETFLEATALVKAP